MVVMFGLVLPLVHHRPFRWCVRRGSLIWRYGTDRYLPARLECVDALPRNGTGKVRKELLRGSCQSKVLDWCPRGLSQDLHVPVIGPGPVVISAGKPDYEIAADTPRSSIDQHIRRRRGQLSIHAARAAAPEPRDEPTNSNS
jgi:hypothetical protein